MDGWMDGWMDGTTERICNAGSSAVWLLASLTFIVALRVCRCGGLLAVRIPKCRFRSTRLLAFEKQNSKIATANTKRQTKPNPSIAPTSPHPQAHTTAPATTVPAITSTKWQLQPTPAVISVVAVAAMGQTLQRPLPMQLRLPSRSRSG